MTLGLTDSAQNFGLTSESIVMNAASYAQDGYGVNVGASISHGTLSVAGAVGITTDTTKSGLIATFSGLTIGTVASEKLGNFYIHY